MRPSAAETTRAMPLPPYGSGSGWPLASLALARTSFRVPTMERVSGMALLGRGQRRLRLALTVGEADRLVCFERALQVEFLRHLAHRRKHLLAEEADTGLGILVRHG